MKIDEIKGFSVRDFVNNADEKCASRSWLGFHVKVESECRVSGSEGEPDCGLGDSCAVEDGQRSRGNLPVERQQRVLVSSQLDPRLT